MRATDHRAAGGLGQHVLALVRHVLVPAVERFREGGREVEARTAFTRHAVAELVRALAVRARADLDVLLGGVVGD